MSVELQESEAAPVVEAQTVEVHFKGNRRAFFTWDNPGEERLRLREAVIVEAARGLDFGRVSKTGDHASKAAAGACNGCAVGAKHSAEPIRKVHRRASAGEIATANQLRRDEESIRQQTIEKVRGHQLEMRVSDTEWQWDRSKLTLYFTAESRVDFRALVRDLAGLFKTRIELRQIGVRDEAARITGVGRCGREYCCSTWLKELSPVSLALAKDQNLSLNPSQISGGCGRLLCCLKYEHEFYAAQRKRFPREGKTIRTGRGPEKVVAVDIFRERIFLRGEEGSRIIPLIELQEEQSQLGDAPAATAPAGGPPNIQRPPKPPERRGDGPARPPRQEERRRETNQRPQRQDERRAEQSQQPPREQERRSPAPQASQPPEGAQTPGQPGSGKSRRNRRRRRGRRGPGGGPGTPPPP
ncbi:MAG TPA: regulatory iron-sulfur-containing complex subunit RicT, partial [Gemmatimonadales bacterium]|nr:regulatory iron-sulfur-containing complex subunit RicT [Gemmatimonadales bacterium]